MASDFSQAFWSVTVAAGTLEALPCVCTITSSSAVLIFLTVALSKSLPFNLLSGSDSWAFPLSFLFSGITLLMGLDQELRRSLVGGSQHCCCQPMANLPCAGTELPEDLACLSSTAPLIARGHQWDPEGSGTLNFMVNITPLKGFAQTVSSAIFSLDSCSSKWGGCSQFPVTNGDIEALLNK